MLMPIAATGIAVNQVKLQWSKVWTRQGWAAWALHISATGAGQAPYREWSEKCSCDLSQAGLKLHGSSPAR